MNTAKTKAGNDMKKKSFEDILIEFLKSSVESIDEEMKGVEKKMEMEGKVAKELEEIKEEIKGYGDHISGSVEIEECDCPKKCGLMKVTVEFTALTFSDDGEKIIRGTIERIVSVK